MRHDDHERFSGKTTFRAAAAYQATDDITLRGSWGEGFKAPTLFQTTFFCCGAEAPNADLGPERSKGFDMTALEDRANLSVTYFNQNAEDILALQPDLIVRSYGGGPNAAAFFKRAGVPVLNVGRANTLGDVQNVVL